MLVDGGWKTSPRALTTAAWRRVQLGDWHADFQLADDVPYSSAERIIRSLKRGQVCGDVDLSVLDAATIEWIVRGKAIPTLGEAPSQDVFDVDLAGQTWLTVRMRPDGVAVLDRRPISGRT